MTRRHRTLALISAAAVALRLLMFTGRGDYIAFDEGWYLLLGRNVFDGDGYTLSGLRHVALSPLFPLLAGALGSVIDDIVWAGRIIAALAGGLLVVPCWHIAQRLGGRTVAMTAASFVAAMPSLAPFVAPFWIGWDLWVGAEPVLHLFVYAGIALTLRTLATRHAPDGALAGLCFGLAYLARPEAVIAGGIAGMIAVCAALLRRDVRRSALPVALIALAFACTAAPYWIYLHDALGRWTLTGREVAAAPALRDAAAGSTSGSRVIDDMLWDRGGATYIETLYALDASGTRLANGYWGVPDTSRARIVLPPSAAPAPATPQRATGPAPAPAPPSRVSLYVQSLGRIVPLYVWSLFLLGMLRIRRRRLLSHVLASAPIVATSALVAIVVAVDPRTQLVIVPLVAIYAARGTLLLGHVVQRTVPPESLRRRFTTLLIAGSVTAVLFGICARRLYLSLSLGSPHHTVGAANRAAGTALRDVVPADMPVMSWHPAIALFADRDWRVLPHAPLDAIVRFAAVSGSTHILLSPYYPGPRLLGDDARDQVLLAVPPDAALAPELHVELVRSSGPLTTGTVRTNR